MHCGGGDRGDGGGGGGGDVRAGWVCARGWEKTALLGVEVEQGSRTEREQDTEREP